MSEMGDYFREYRQEKQSKKSIRLKKNTELIEFLAGDLDFELIKHSDVHFSLMHPQAGRLDIWPSTGKAHWLNVNKYFTITNMEEYIVKHFKKDK